MTYYGAKQLADSFRTVRANTIAIAEEIPEDKYSFRATPEVMSVAQILAHLAVHPDWQMEVHGPQPLTHLDFPVFTDHQQKAAAAERALTTKAEILHALKDGGAKFASFLDQLPESTLSSTVTFPPPLQPTSKTRFEMLLGVKEHEMHHRGQLMLIQRLLGQVPPLTRRRQERAAARA